MRYLEATGFNHPREQRGLALVFADTPTLVRAVIWLVLKGNIRQFHVSAPEDD
jgi:hypothetical protein